jgi:hypothetical protein
MVLDGQSLECVMYLFSDKMAFQSIVQQALALLKEAMKQEK